MEKAYPWLLAGHLIALLLWAGAITTIYWFLRMHDHAPREMRDKLTLMERSLGLSADIAITVAMACGIALIFSGPGGNWLTAGKVGSWLHIKLAVIVLALLPVHGMLRARIAKYGRGEIKQVPAWVWSLFLAGIAIAVICATAVKFKLIQSVAAGG